MARRITHSSSAPLCSAGETLLVLGAAGGVGLAAVELGRAMGARVIAAASSDEKLAVARAAGAVEGINYSTESMKDRVKTLTDGKGVDVVYDPVGGELSEQALRATGWNGRLLVIGFAAGDIPGIPLNLPLSEEQRHRRRILGCLDGARSRGIAAELPGAVSDVPRRRIEASRQSGIRTG